MRISAAAAAALVAASLLAFCRAPRAHGGAQADGRSDDPPTVRLSSRALLRRTVNCRAPSFPKTGHVRVRSVVSVEVLIDEGGAVSSARVVSGHPFFHRSAVQAASGWTFRPVKVRGRPARAAGVLRLLFSPDAREMRGQCARRRPLP